MKCKVMQRVHNFDLQAAKFEKKICHLYVFYTCIYSALECILRLCCLVMSTALYLKWRGATGYLCSLQLVVLRLVHVYHAMHELQLPSSLAALCTCTVDFNGWFQLALIKDDIKGLVVSHMHQFSACVCYFVLIAIQFVTIVCFRVFEPGLASDKLFVCFCFWCFWLFIKNTIWGTKSNSLLQIHPTAPCLRDTYDTIET